jgi:DNA-binding CsgD family transcriptional regulator
MSSCTLEVFIEETNRAESARDVCALFGAALSSFGYDRFCYSLITPHPSLGLDAGHGVVKNYPDDWMDYYESNQYQKRDPVPQQARADFRPFAWDTISEIRALNSEQQKIMNEAHEAGLMDGIGVPLWGANGELAGVGIASSQGGIQVDSNVLGKVRALAMQFHLAYTELVRAERTKNCDAARVKLTVREKEILLWAAEGKSDAVIASIIGVSHSTIRFHMNNIFRKLDANERTLATVKAIRLGLIVPACYAS